MTAILRATQRYRTDQPGITTWHCFSSGAHFNPDNVAFGRLVACDEHLVAPGAGFAMHAHRRVELVTWVLDGTLEHRNPSGPRRRVGPGIVQYQSAGDGIRHSERNASSLEPLRFVQLWLLNDTDRVAYDVAPPPITLTVGSFDVLRRCRGTRIAAPLIHLFVGVGNFHVEGTDLTVGDSLRAAGSVEIDGNGELLAVTLFGQ